MQVNQNAPLAGLSFFAIFLTLLHPLTSQGKLICNQPVFDFGTVQTGEQIKHTFKLNNTGDAPIFITDIDSPCGCMEASKPDNAIAPGGEFELTVSLDLQGRRGPQNRRIYLRANHELQPSVVLTMRGHAAEGLRIQPAILVLHDHQAAELWTGKVTVSSPDKKAFEVLWLQSDNPMWSLEAAANPGNHNWEIRARRKMPPPPGQERSSVKLRTNHPFFPEAEFQILTVAPVALIYTPEKLEFLEEVGAVKESSILIRMPDNEVLEILHVELPQGGMTWETITSGEEMLQLKISGIHPVESLHNQKLKIHFAGAGERSIEVPVIIHKADVTLPKD